MTWKNLKKESREKGVEGIKSFWKSDKSIEIKRRWSERMKKDNPSFKEEVIQKIREKAKERNKNPEFKEKFKKAMGTERIRKMRSTRIIEWHKNKTPEQEKSRREKIRKTSIEQWERGNNGYHPNKILASHNHRTWIEKLMKERLEREQISFEEQKRVGRYVPDFMIGNLIVECDGEQWHTDKTQEYDRKREDYIREKGYNIVRFKGVQIVNNLDECITVIRDMLEGEK